MHLRLAATSLLLAAALGCSSKSTPTPTVDAGSAAVVGRSCSIDAECGALRCDPVRLQCICLSDADCPNQFCSNFTGLCVDTVPGCTSDRQCHANQFCNPDTRACQDTRAFCQSCKAEIECGGGNHCLADSTLVNSFCAKGCTTTADCPNGTVCEAAGGDHQCLPKPGTTCATFTGCVPDALTSCNGNGDCVAAGTDQVCDVGSGLCRARLQICPLGTVCDPAHRVCVNSCSIDRDCADATLACVNHFCQPVAQCTSDSNCPSDKVCDVPPGATGGKCVPFCANDASCAPGRVCQPVIEPDGSTRRACLPGCASNHDCNPNEVCEDANGAPFVLADGGSTLGQCNTALNGKRACQTTEACGGCQLCEASNTCAPAGSMGYCHACNPQNGNGDCAAFGTNATCLSLAGRDSNGNIVGSGPFACGVPCDPPGTADQTSCPKGFVCAALTNSSGGNTSIYNCVPADFDCKIVNQASQKCP